MQATRRSCLRLTARACAVPVRRVDPQVREAILEVTRSLGKVEPKQVSETAKFKDLGLDSLDVVELIVAYEEHLGVELKPEDAESRISGVDDAIAVFSEYRLAEEAGAEGAEGAKPL